MVAWCSPLYGYAAAAAQRAARRNTTNYVSRATCHTRALFFCAALVLFLLSHC
jgi:hypothetical protein